MSRRILVHTEKTAPRVRHIFGLMLGERLGLDPTFTDDLTVFLQEDGPKLSYGGEALSGAPHFHAHGLLFELGIRPIDPEVTVDENGHIMVFPHENGKGELAFDPFAAAFYLTSRYEEYLPHATDRHGRYDPVLSLAFRSGFLKIPVVDHWVLMLRDVLSAHFPKLSITRPGYRFTSTIDVDNAFAYRHKGPVRTAGAMLRSIGKGEHVMGRIATLVGLSPDPYDTYSFLRAAHGQYGADARFFFLLADPDHHDRNLPHTCAALRQLITETAEWAEVGIHPGFRSNSEPQRVAMEKSRLENILQERVTGSRQHFLLMRFPDTYRTLANAGITDDHSMGYATRTGFRAGTSDSFLFYDLGKEESTALRIHPFACMDATLRQYLGLTPAKAMAEVDLFAESIRAVGGHFISLWHNETVSDHQHWAGWRDVFVHTLKVGTAK
ncbi:MAG: polysaccharide deacetylase family protein [Flavobacteriales bacterium]|nr:polysaccharide deacetylase family protein [Flavobacteriales bacterium]